MIALTYFESEEDLQRLTGLDHDGLWDAGFNLDDWDFGFRTKRKLHNEKVSKWVSEWTGTEYEEKDISFRDNLSEGYYLYRFVEGNCVGCQATFYKGYWYYMEYHS